MYPGSGALFVESRSDPSQFYLLVPVNLGAGRPFALFGTGGDYESDLEKAEAYGKFWALSWRWLSERLAYEMVTALTSKTQVVKSFIFASTYTA